jgi:hypothetical protein
MRGWRDEADARQTGNDVGLCVRVSREHKAASPLAGSGVTSTQTLASVQALSDILFIDVLQRTFERGWYPGTLNIFVTLPVQDLMDWEDLPSPSDLYQKIFMSVLGPFTRSRCCHP